MRGLWTSAPRLSPAAYSFGKKTPMPRLNTIFPPVPEAPLKRPGLRNDEYMIYYINYLINHILYILFLRKLFKGPCLRSIPRGIIRGNIQVSRAYTLGDILRGTCSRGMLGGYSWGTCSRDMLRGHTRGACFKNIRWAYVVGAAPRVALGTAPGAV